METRRRHPNVLVFGIMMIVLGAVAIFFGLVELGKPAAQHSWETDNRALGFWLAVAGGGMIPTGFFMSMTGLIVRAIRETK